MEGGRSSWLPPCIKGEVRGHITRRAKHAGGRDRVRREDLKEPHRCLRESTLSNTVFWDILLLGL